MAKRYIPVDIDLLGNKVTHFLVEPLTADPEGVDGRMYYNTSTKRFRYYDGAWVDVSNARDDAALRQLISDLSSRITTDTHTLSVTIAELDTRLKGETAARELSMKTEADIRAEAVTEAKQEASAQLIRSEQAQAVVNRRYDGQITSLQTRMETKADKTEVNSLSDKVKYVRCVDDEGTPITYIDGNLFAYGGVEGQGVSAQSVDTERLTAGSVETGDVIVDGESLMEDILPTKQNALVSGSNIKTVNGESLLGSGNIEIQGGGGSIDSRPVAEETATPLFPYLEYVPQNLTPMQQLQARGNIGAVDKAYVDNSFAVLDTDISTIQEDLEEIREDVSGKQDKDKMQSVMTASTVNYPSSKAVMDYAASKTEVSGINGYIKMLESAITAVDTEVGDLTDSVDGLTDRTNDMGDAVDVLTNKVNDLYDDYLNASSLL